uniref:Phosphoglycerate mutase n=2 Tax=Canis lupus familiaris TaxID=9615 RepID=A0A8C0T1A7_CANLF
MAKYKLIMLRHGEGAWNKENRFCSWVDQKLNSEGMEEARNCGKQLKALNLEFDLVFTSILNRSIHTAWLILEELGQEWVPVESSWRLNERHYGALIGLNREQMALNHGEEQVRLWRRSYNVTPPPIEESHPYYHEIYNDRRYKVCDIPVDQLPRSESLKDVLERLLPFWNERIAPEVLSGKTILISAHGNSSRALLKHLEGLTQRIRFRPYRMCPNHFHPMSGIAREAWPRGAVPRDPTRTGQLFLCRLGPGPAGFLLTAEASNRAAVYILPVE